MLQIKIHYLLLFIDFVINVWWYVAVLRVGKKKVSNVMSEKKEKKVKEKKPLTTREKILIALIVIVVILLLAGVSVFLVFHHYYSKLKFDDGKGNLELITTEYVPDEEVDVIASDSDAELVETVEQELMENLEDESSPIMFSDDVYNILLIGNDSRDKNTLGRSDSMIIVSINRKTEEIIMTSIMRDSYVAIPGYWSSRINAAYAFGGPDLLINTIESNFKINIDKYVAVNFYSFMDAVDAVGGVEITVSDAEVGVMNNYIEELNKLNGQASGTDRLSKGGTYNLNGKQALAYSRVRYVGNADYERTERQRRVLETMFNKVKDSGISELTDLLNAVLPETLTNISESEMLGLLIDFPTKYNKYNIKQCRVPCDGTIQNLVIGGAMVLGIDLNANIQYLHQNIYGE